MGLLRTTWVLLIAVSGGLAFLVHAQEGVNTKRVVIPGTGVTFDIVFLNGGKYRMGSPADEAGRDWNELQSSDMEVMPFWIGKNEVTFKEFDLYVKNPKDVEVDGIIRPTLPGPAGIIAAGIVKDKNPIVGLRYHSAMGYCQFLSRKTGHLYRLPTESEWEYACRAGSDKAHCHQVN